MERRIKIKIYPPSEGPTKKKLKTVSKSSNKATATGVTTGNPGSSGGNIRPVATHSIKVELDLELDPQPENNETELHNPVLSDVKMEESETTNHGHETGRDRSSSVPNKDKKFKCVLCSDKSFDLLKYLKQHHKKVHKITWKATEAQIRANTCKKCGKVFRCPSWLHGHTLSHLDVRNEKCQICPNRAYKTLTSLREHLRIAHVGKDLNAVEKAWCLSILPGQKKNNI